MELTETELLICEVNKIEACCNRKERGWKCPRLTSFYSPFVVDAAFVFASGGYLHFEVFLQVTADIRVTNEVDPEISNRIIITACTWTHLGLTYLEDEFGLN